MSPAAGDGGDPVVGGRRREALILAAICTLAICVRALFLSRWASTPLFNALLGDEAHFHSTALGLIGQGPSSGAFLYQPLYSYYLAVAYGLFGLGPGGVRTLQLFIGVAGVLLAYGLGRELAGRWAGRISACLVALFGPLVFFEGHLLAPGLVFPLVTGGLWCLLAAGLRERSWLLVPAGLLAGLALMGRPNLVAVLPVVLVWLVIRPWTWRRRLAAAGLAMVGLLIGLAPSTIHNLISRASLVPVSNSLGHSFYLGNNPQANGRFRVPRGEGIDPRSHAAYQQSLRRIAERAAGRSLTPGEVSSYWAARGLDFWGEQPGRALALLGRKLLLAINSQEQPIHHPIEFGQQVAPILRILLPFGVIFAFAVLGVTLAGRTTPGVGLLTACAVAYWFSLGVFYVADRYRLVMVPMLVPLAGLGMVALAVRFRERGFWGAWPALAVLAVAFALTQLPLTSAGERDRMVAAGFNRMGTAAGNAGDLVQAESAFRKAVELAGPGQGALARTNLGLLAQRRGDLDAAQRWYRSAVEADPDRPGALQALARLAEQRGRWAEAIGWWQQVASLQADSRATHQRIQTLRARLAPPPADPPPDPGAPAPDVER